MTPFKYRLNFSLKVAFAFIALLSLGISTYVRTRSDWIKKQADISERIYRVEGLSIESYSQQPPPLSIPRINDGKLYDTGWSIAIYPHDLSSYDDLSILKDCDTVEEIKLIGVGCTDDFIDKLVIPPKTRQVALYDTSISAEGIRRLYRISPDLEAILFFNTNDLITDEVSKAIAEYDHIKVIDVSGTPVSLQCLRNIAGIKTISMVIASSSLLTAEAVATLNSDFPNVVFRAP